MWAITVFGEDHTTTMYEFETEEEARDAFKKTKGCKILSEIVYIKGTRPAITSY